MRKFNDFLKKLLEKPSIKTILLIKGKKKRIKAMARYTTVNYAGDEYIKTIFDDHSFMLIIPKEQEIYYAESILGRAGRIDDEIIGKDQIIVYKGKKYELGNPNDYQFRLQLYVGTPLEIEGEVRFSDYFPIEGQKEFLSLG